MVGKVSDLQEGLKKGRGLPRTFIKVVNEREGPSFERCDGKGSCPSEMSRERQMPSQDLHKGLLFVGVIHFGILLVKVSTLQEGQGNGRGLPRTFIKVPFLSRSKLCPRFFLSGI